MSTNKRTWLSRDHTLLQAEAIDVGSISSIFLNRLGARAAVLKSNRVGSAAEDDEMIETRKRVGTVNAFRALKTMRW